MQYNWGLYILSASLVTQEQANSFFFFWWTQGFVLAKQVLYHLSHTSSPFCCGYFGDGVSWAGLEP
jgi:hypothetical protein